MVTTTTQDRSEGMAKLNTTLQVIRDKIEEKDGNFNVKMEVGLMVQVIYPVSEKAFEYLK